MIARPALASLHTALSALGAAGLLVVADGSTEDAETPPPVDFGRDVRPILSDKCFECHGPDEDAREADLRLDLEDEAFRDLGGYFAIVPGDASESELYLRVSDRNDPMPPRKAPKQLSADEVELLRRWIDEGARWEEHWAYRAPVRVEPPSRPAGDDVEPGIAERWDGPIDRFLLARMRASGLSPAPEASPETLVRRAALDLTGLPAPLALVDELVAAEDRDAAYASIVDRLLDSPQYGEHMARAWLDAARYGDTHGYHLDNERRIWPYRDWVVEAFNANMPFDQFTVEQLAGDLLPDATTSQRVATGFNRCNPTSAEGGMIAEEYLAKYASDRAITTASVWLGTTMLCAQCHDHKFDPVSQREFYELYAFFNSVAEDASDGNGFAPRPTIPVPNDEHRAALDELTRRIDERTERLEAPDAVLDAAQRQWESEWRARLATRWTTLETVATDTFGDAKARSTLVPQEDGSLLATGDVPAKEVYEVLATAPIDRIAALRLEALPDASLGHESVGRASHGNIVLSNVSIAVQNEAKQFEDVELALAVADYSQKKFHVQRAIDDDPVSGWAIDGISGRRVVLLSPAAPFDVPEGALVRVRLHFESQYPQHQIGRFRLSVSDDASFTPSTLSTWSLAGPYAAETGALALSTAFDAETDPASATWTEHPEWMDGTAVEFELGDGVETGNSAVYLRRTITSPDARELTLGLGSDDALRVWLDGEQVFESDAPRPVGIDQDLVTLSLRPGVNELVLKVVNYAGGFAFSARRVEEVVGELPVAIASAFEADGEDARLREHFRSAQSAEWRALRDERDALRDERAELEKAAPTTLVMEELAEPRTAYVLERGLYDHKGDEVQPGTPSFLPPLVVQGGDDGAPVRPTRLDLARWIVSPDNPLTARVAVNRLWQEVFGVGLVKTSQDFGSQGEWPSHPELLDWLADEFVTSGWDVKHVLRLMLTSAAYRQSSDVSAEKLAVDPHNRLLARGARFRLDAERIRDGALAISGLLNPKMGGPPVKPYQPPGIWKAVAYTSSNTANFMRDEGDALYRRSLYTFWKRTAPPPNMQIFDAPTREVCTIARARTNTPLQALALMNDVQFFEAARAFAERVLHSDARDDDARLELAFRLATARRPNAHELDVMRSLLDEERAAYAANPSAAAALIEVGESERDDALDPLELAAWTHVTNLILNLDEVVTKG